MYPARHTKAHGRKTFDLSEHPGPVSTHSYANTGENPEDSSQDASATAVLAKDGVIAPSCATEDLEAQCSICTTEMEEV
jgi:hypothetical protein